MEARAPAALSGLINSAAQQRSTIKISKIGQILHFRIWGKGARSAETLRNTQIFGARSAETLKNTYTLAREAPKRSKKKRRRRRRSRRRRRRRSRRREEEEEEEQ